MKILVAIKQVLRLDDEFELNESGTDVDAAYCNREMNEWDDYALETALRLREQGGDQVSVLALTVGPPETVEELRKCLAKGADRALRVWDERLAGAGSIACARVIAAVAQREAVGLVLCGVQGSDHAQAATGVAAAGFLGWPSAAVVSRVEYTSGAPQARIRRELEGGLEEDVAIACPAVLTIQVGINIPRYASLRGIKQAAARPIETPSLSELGIDEESIDGLRVSRTRRVYIPDRVQPEMIAGSVSEQAARLAAIVRAATGATS